MPSLTAARVAASAPSVRWRFSLSTTSVAAPTWITASRLASLARRSRAISRSFSCGARSASLRICPSRVSTASAVPAPSTNVHECSVTITRRALPRYSRRTFSSVSPASSVMTSPPVKAARSLRWAMRRCPKPGARTATASSVPCEALWTSIPSAAPSTFSARITSGRGCFMTVSSSGIRSCTAEIGFVVMKMYGSS